MLQEDNGRVKVYARIRPTARFAQDMIELLPDGKSLNIHCKKDLRRGYINNQILDWSFHLDRVLHNASQSDVYKECAANIVSKGLNGYNGTILAYGQTGAGKTFTMTGSTEKFQHRGIIPRAIQQVYREIRERPENAVTVRISYLEIYNEHMFDLLCTLRGTVSNPSLMAVTEDDDGFTRVKGLSVHQANSEEEALNLLFEVRIIPHRQMGGILPRKMFKTEFLRSGISGILRPKSACYDVSFFNLWVSIELPLPKRP